MSVIPNAEKFCKENGYVYRIITEEDMHIIRKNNKSISINDKIGIEFPLVDKEKVKSQLK